MRAALERVMSVGTPSNRLLRFGLLVLAAVPTSIAAVRLVAEQLPGIDLLIPLLATQRWLDGGQPYLASSFDATVATELPFLYPPYALPLLAPLLQFPTALVLAGWVGICAGVSAWALLHLDIPPRWWLVFLIWPPFLEGIVSGNVAVLTFAAFVALFFERSRLRASLRPRPRDPADPARRGLIEGLKATAVPAVKVGQLHSWVYLLLHRPRAALAGLGLLAGVILVTLPATGIDLWIDWLGQLQRASDPSWMYAGNGLGRLVPAGVAIAITIGTVVALRWVPRAGAGVWVGLLTVVGGLSVHTYGLLFLLPAMLRLRREIALIGALFIGARNPTGILVGASILVLATAASIAIPQLREPDAVEDGS